MSFDPETVERFDCSRHEGMVWADPGDYVPSGDYDKLLEINRELLEALKNLKCWASQVPVDWVDAEATAIAQATRSACEQADAAIAKAEGK